MPGLISMTTLSKISAANRELLRLQFKNLPAAPDCLLSLLAEKLKLESVR